MKKREINFTLIQLKFKSLSIKLEDAQLSFTPYDAWFSKKFPFTKIEVIELRKTEISLAQNNINLLQKLVSSLNTKQSFFYEKELEYENFYDFTIYLNDGTSATKRIQNFDLFFMKEAIPFLNARIKATKIIE